VKFLDERALTSGVPCIGCPNDGTPNARSAAAQSLALSGELTHRDAGSAKRVAPCPLWYTDDLAPRSPCTAPERSYINYPMNRR
jgi:hypothetical protein